MTNELELTRGDTTTYRVVVKLNGDVFDLTDYTSRFTVKANKKDSNDNAIIGPIVGTTVVAADGTINFVLTSANSAVDAGTYYYDVEITDGTNVYTVINSTITVVLDISK